MSAPSQGRLARAFDWAFRNRVTGEITVGQFPNLPIALFALASGVAWLAGPEGRIAGVARIAADASLAWWAADELLRGVNPWRRTLGACVLVYLAAGIVRS